MSYIRDLTVSLKWNCMNDLFSLSYATRTHVCVGKTPPYDFTNTQEIFGWCSTWCYSLCTDKVQTYIDKIQLDHLVLMLLMMYLKIYLVHTWKFQWSCTCCLCFKLVLFLSRRYINLSLPWKKWSPFRRWYFRCIFVKEKFCILIKISLKFVPKGWIDNPKLVQIMVWCRIGDKPLSEPMLTRFTDTFMQH